MDCLFCKIVLREIPAEIIYEDDASLAFLDINPCSPGHTVVIPKIHVETILEIEDGKLGNIFMAVKRVTGLLKDKLGGNISAEDFTLPNFTGQSLGGFTIGINHGSLAGQTVLHFHIHIIPRYKGDRGGSMHSVVHYATGHTVEAVARKINGGKENQN